MGIRPREPSSFAEGRHTHLTLPSTTDTVVPQRMESWYHKVRIHQGKAQIIVPMFQTVIRVVNHAHVPRRQHGGEAMCEGLDLAVTALVAVNGC